MLHNRNFPPGSPQEWLQYAYSDLDLARAKDISERVLLEELCFHAQQVVEKSLKALLIAKKVSFPKTHNIRTLIDLLSNHYSVPSELDEAAVLTDYAVESRYPGIIEPVEEEEYFKAVEIAESVLKWVESILPNENR